MIKILCLFMLASVCAAKWVTQYEYDNHKCKGDALSFSAIIPDTCAYGESIFESEYEHLWTCENGSAVVREYEYSTSCTGSPLDTSKEHFNKQLI